MRAPIGPSPSTAWVAPGTSGSERAMIAFRASSESGSSCAIRSTARTGSRFSGIVGALSIIACARAPAARTSAGIAAVSGMFRQYLRGISARMASRLSRAGLKVLS